MARIIKIKWSHEEDDMIYKFAVELYPSASQRAVVGMLREEHYALLKVRSFGAILRRIAFVRLSEKGGI